MKSDACFGLNVLRRTSAIANLRFAQKRWPYKSSYKSLSKADTNLRTNLRFVRDDGHALLRKARPTYSFALVLDAQRAKPTQEDL